MSSPNHEDLLNVKDGEEGFMETENSDILEIQKMLKLLRQLMRKCLALQMLLTLVRQLMIQLCKLHIEVRKASNRAVREKENLALISIPGLLAERSFFPITHYSALELSTLVQGSGEKQGEDVTHLPKYIQLLSKQVFEEKNIKTCGSASS
jgi:hypothetical protein